MKEPSEQEIQKVIMDYLRLKKFIVFKHRNVGIYKQSTGKYIPLPYGEKGISDIIACSPEGNFFAIEVKTRKGNPTPEQLDFIARVNATKKGVGIIARSLEEVIVTIENLARGDYSIGKY